ncbi:hypothetical protein [Ruegeria atlantica]|uniref:hypothetical protein n=1 Tax=Ruegeria atlantica TaxID=81569 RepID=UPI001479983C|nr:hypothetical protein [Ruegeria atlantica]
MKTRKVDPSSTQTKYEIEQYLRSVNEGDEVVIRSTQGGLLDLKVTKVTGTKPSAGRLYTEHSGGWGGTAWYAKSGKNCYAPKAQSNLVIPTREVLEYASSVKTPEFYVVAPGSHML